MFKCLIVLIHFNILGSELIQVFFIYLCTSAVRKNAATNKPSLHKCIYPHAINTAIMFYLLSLQTFPVHYSYFYVIQACYSSKLKYRKRN